MISFWKLNVFSISGRSVSLFLRVTFSLSVQPAIQNSTPNQMVSTPTVGSHEWVLQIILTCLGWTSTIYRFYRLWTSKAYLPIPSCHFTLMTQFWSIEFLGINTNLSIRATLLRVHLFDFLRLLRTRCTPAASSWVPDAIFVCLRDRSTGNLVPSLLGTNILWCWRNNLSWEQFSEPMTVRITTKNDSWPQSVIESLAPSLLRDAPLRLTLGQAPSIESYLSWCIHCGTNDSPAIPHHMRGIPDGWQEAPQCMHLSAHEVCWG